MTDRIIKGLSHPKAKILGHPTGRLIGGREGYELDWDRLFDFCLKNKKILEIDAWPNRLDLPDFIVKEAVKAGVMLVIDTDSHLVDQMILMEYGVSVARRGWAEKKNIVNSLPKNRIDDILLG
jgi:DNA polymerase (family 10)